VMTKDPARLKPLGPGAFAKTADASVGG
jgi:hypothetical protein